MWDMQQQQQNLNLKLDVEHKALFIRSWQILQRNRDDLWNEY